MIINDLFNNKKFVAEDIGDLGYNVVRYYEKTQEVKKLTNWLEKEAGLPRNSPLYFDDVDLVYGNKTIVPGALINPKLTFNDLLTAVVQASKQGMAEATGDEKFDTMMGQIQKEPKYPDSQMPPTDVKDLYQWAVENNKLYHEIFAEWANREGYKSVAPALQRAGDLDTEALDYWTPRVWKIYWGEVRGIDSEMPPEWAKKRVPDELRDYLETVFDAYNRIVFDWPTEYRQIGQQGMAEAIGDLGSKRDQGKSVRKWRKSRGLDETGQGPVTHRIGLTVTDPNHPMVSKRKEPYQKSIRITQNVSDREAAINQAIAHYRRKGYKVHDHHYIGTVDQGVAEGKKPDNYHIVNKDGKPASLASYADRASAEKDRDEKHPGAEVRQVGPRGKVKNVSEVSLGDYRKKATVNKAVAQANKFFDRDDAAKVAAADQTIAKREKGLARADARVKPYTPPKFDAEKHQRDLTAKYPNIDELVAAAEQRRDPNYDRAEGNAYYDGREAEQNYQKLKQIQRVIQGLNESQAPFKKSYLYEGLNRSSLQTVKLWESAGQRIVEAQLTADQINQLFTAAEQGATAAGGNRTMIGKGKDAATAVNRAWEDLKTKVQNSGPIKSVDAAYDSAAEKLKQATGGDQGVMKYVEKYRAFAKANPVAQSLIYSALIAAAGISGAGLGGAAALGLFKLVDKLLQGEKFSSAAYSGAKTGALAYGASKIGDLIKGKPDAVDTQMAKGLPDQIPRDAATQAATSIAGGAREQAQAVAQKAIADAIASGTPAEATSQLADVAAQAIEKFGTNVGGTLNPQTLEMMAEKAAMIAAKQAGAVGVQESISHKLTEADLYFLFSAATQLNEGIWDSIKGTASKYAGKAADWAKTKGTNLTTKVTADKLKSAWTKAGSPTDSDAVYQVLTKAGVAPQVMDTVYKSMNVPAPGQKTTSATPGANTAAAPAQPGAPKAPTAAAATASPAAQPEPTAEPTAGDKAPAPASGTKFDLMGQPYVDQAPTSYRAQRDAARAARKTAAEPVATTEPTPAVASEPTPAPAPAPKTATTPAPKTTAPTAGVPGFNAGNLAQLPGMAQYMKPQPKVTPDYSKGPTGYGKTTMSVNPMQAKTAAPTASTPKMAPAPKPVAPVAAPAAKKEPITIGGQKITPNDPAYDKIMKNATATTTAPVATPKSTTPAAVARPIDPRFPNGKYDEVTGEATPEWQAELDKQTAAKQASLAQVSAPQTTRTAASQTAPVTKPLATVPKTDTEMDAAEKVQIEKMKAKNPNLARLTALDNELAESLTWSRNFDPGRSLYRQIKQDI